ncbi:MAG: 2'-5' RNA ligase family protein, partial [Planctomycetes bacterium]|nr:2'-5' RNA ligase family protein [Planctomycetota bacterium]
LVVDLWRQVERTYEGFSLPAIGARPHISLGVFDSAGKSHARIELEKIAAHNAPFEIRFSHIGIFPTTEGVVFLAPEPNERLTQLQIEVHNCIKPYVEMTHRYYDPALWQPHCTVAIWLDKTQALETCRNFKPVPVAIATSIGVVKVHNGGSKDMKIEELFTLPLGGRR